jgi:protein involved in polysaccharide export with SLBB domain
METSLVAVSLQGGGADKQSAASAIHSLVQRLRQTEPDGRIVLNLPVSAHDLPGDMTLENNDRIIVPARVETVGVFGAVYRPASFSLLGQPPMTVRTMSTAPAGPRGWPTRARSSWCAPRRCDPATGAR